MSGFYEDVADEIDLELSRLTLKAQIVADRLGSHRTGVRLPRGRQWMEIIRALREARGLVRQQMNVKRREETSHG